MNYYLDGKGHYLVQSKVKRTPLTLEEAWSLFCAVQFVYQIPNHGRPIEDVISDQIQRHVLGDFGPYVSLEYQVLEDARELIINVDMDQNWLPDDMSGMLTRSSRESIGGLCVPRTFDDTMYYKASNGGEKEVDVTLTLKRVVSSDPRIIPWIKYH
jgi:hypothetical protein